MLVVAMIGVRQVVGGIGRLRPLEEFRGHPDRARKHEERDGSADDIRIPGGRFGDGEPGGPCLSGIVGAVPVFLLTSGFTCRVPDGRLVILVLRYTHDFSA